MVLLEKRKTTTENGYLYCTNEGGYIEKGKGGLKFRKD
jgi:hypothetical protein